MAKGRPVQIRREAHDFWCKGPLPSSSWRYVQCPTCNAEVDMWGGNEL